jgi:hypothetical protein
MRAPLPLASVSFPSRALGLFLLLGALGCGEGGRPKVVLPPSEADAASPSPPRPDAAPRRDAAGDAAGTPNGDVDGAAGGDAAIDGRLGRGGTLPPSDGGGTDARAAGDARGPEDASPSGFVAADHPLIRYMGRVDRRDPKKVALQWPGTTITARFEGTSIKVRMDDGTFGAWSTYWAILDGDDAKPVALTMEAGKTEYEVKAGLADGVHTIQLVRLEGGWNRITTFRGFVLDPGKRLLELPAAPTRKMEFFGDSITEASYLPEGEPHETNNYISWAYVLARRLGASYSAIAQGGLGLIKGFALPRTLPNMVERLLPGKPADKWDFAQWQADVVFVNIMQNDKWTLGGSMTGDEIKAVYAKQITDLRAKYPSAHIFCLLGPMDASEARADNPYPAYVKDTVAALNAAGDKKIYAHILPFIGGKGHPSRAQHAAVAAELEPLVRAKTGW